jgi:hypothetical protein
MKIECVIAKKNYNLIKEVDFYEQLHIGDDWVSNLVNHVYKKKIFYNKKFQVPNLF